MFKPLQVILCCFWLSSGSVSLAATGEAVETGGSSESEVMARPGQAALNTPADSAVHELKKLLEPLTSVSADFRQQLYSADAYEIQDNQGHMQVSAPGKIRWLVDSPMEQWLISDGHTLWLYDPDLEQVTIRPFDQDIAVAPALLLTGSVGELSDAFEVSEVAVTINDGDDSASALPQGARRFKLVPRGAQALYDYLTFDFDGPKPLAIAIVDSLGQRTQITFSDVVLNEKIDPRLYSFEPPPGIDVVFGQ